jgi:hypothetical protein
MLVTLSERLQRSGIAEPLGARSPALSSPQGVVPITQELHLVEHRGAGYVDYAAYDDVVDLAFTI